MQFETSAAINRFLNMNADSEGDGLDGSGLSVLWLDAGRDRPSLALHQSPHVGLKTLTLSGFCLVFFGGGAEILKVRVFSGQGRLQLHFFTILYFSGSHPGVRDPMEGRQRA